MGVTGSRPYIFDEFDSEEDDGDANESAVECQSEPALLTAASLSQSEESSVVTSSWPSKTQDEISEKLSSILQLQNGDAGDLNDDDDDAQRRALAQLDQELIQFEANEEKVSLETPVLPSGIPRLKSGSLRSGRSSGFGTDVSKRSPTERKRSPSPHGNRPSGIPRYSWAHVAPISPGISLGETKTEVQALDASSLSNTLESLSESSDRRRQTSSNKSNSTSENSGICQCMKTTGNSPQWDINVSDLTGRVKMKKKHLGLPSLWTKADGPQRLVKTAHMNESQQGICSSASSDIATEDVATCRAIGEWGGPSERKVLDLRRWYCISRPQYKTSCGISAVVSCWNYLFSTMGCGSLPPITQETAMKLLGFTSPFDSIKFGPVTGNQTVLRWFSELNTHFNVNGRCFIMYKPAGKNPTISVTEQMALDSLKKGLKDPSTAFIYHCHNHYFCPIGYEDTSQFCVDAYKSDIGENVESWVLCGDTGRRHSPINCQSWEKICLDLNCKCPSYFDIRQSWKGVMQRKNITTVGENLHCIMTFQKILSKLYAPIMRLYEGYRNPPLRNHRTSASKFISLPSPKEEDENHIHESSESQVEGIKYSDSYKNIMEGKENCDEMTLDDDSEF